MNDLTYTLDQIDAACEAATEGPWEYGCDGHTDTISGDGEDWFDVRAPSGIVTGCVLTGDDSTDEQTEADHAFIALARTALPELAAKVRELQDAITETGTWLAATGYPVQFAFADDHPVPPRPIWEALVDHVHADKHGTWHGNELDRDDVDSWLLDELGLTEYPTTPTDGA